METVQFQNNYMLGLAEASGWLREPGRDSWGDGEISTELREAARQWWSEFNENVMEMEFPSGSGLFSAIGMALHGDEFGFSDGKTDYVLIHSTEAAGWFILLKDPDVIGFLLGDDADDLPDLAAIQGFSVKLCDNGGWEIVFEEIKKEAE